MREKGKKDVAGNFHITHLEYAFEPAPSLVCGQAPLGHVEQTRRSVAVAMGRARQV